MPLFDLEDPITGDIITVDHPQAPTQEEAQSILSSLAPKSNTVADREVALGLLGGSGKTMTREEAVRANRQRTLQRAELEGEKGSYKIVNAGTPQESLQSIIPNSRFNAPSHLSQFGESFKQLVPFVGSGREFSEGARSGKQLVGDNLVGSAIGNLVLGPARVANTAFNPIGGIIGEIPVATQAGGAAAGGDLEAALRTLNGEQPVTSAATIPQANTGISALDTLLNTNVNIGNAVVDQPMLLAGLTPEALRTQGTAIRNLPSNLRTLATETARVGSQEAGRLSALFRGTTPIDAEAVAAAQKRVQDLEYLREQNKINTSKTQEVRNAQDLILQEEINKAALEARSLGSQALQANQDLGTQIQNLNLRASEIPNIQQRITSGLPAVQEPSQFGSSLGEAIDAANRAAKAGATIDYSAVKQSLPETQPKIQSTNTETIVQQILTDKNNGLSADFSGKLRSALGELSPVKKVDPLSNLSASTRDIYERLPDIQKQSFLDQSGINLKATTQKTYTWDQLQGRYQALNSLIEDAKKNNPSDAYAYQQIKNATIADMNAYVENIGTDTKSLFDEANANYAANQQKFGTSRITPLISDLAKESPENIVTKIVGDKKASVVNNLRQILSPEKFQEVQAQYADHLFSPSKDIPFDSNHFIKQFDSINNETLRAAFGDEGFNELQRIHDLAKGEIQAKELQGTLDEYNSKAQKAEDAYQKAKSSADERRILESERADAEAAINAIKDEKFNRDIEKARSDLKKAQTPEKISLIVRALYGLTSFAGLAATGNPVAGVAAGLAAAAFGKLVHRNIGKPLLDAAIARLNKGK